MFKRKKSDSTLFRSPVRTLTKDEITLITGATRELRETGKPSQTPIDVEGFR